MRKFEDAPASLVEQLSGVWKLVSYEYQRADGQPAVPALGPDPIGRLMYDPSGLMSVHIMSLDRPIFESGDRLRGDSDKVKAAYEGYLAYFGTYEVREAEGIIIHRVEGSLFPNWVGTDQTRFFQLKGDKLTLRTPPRPEAGGEVAVLVWERMK
ncbi:MAG TPA: lipocalin-like domain-containing protein [Dehalococcoidia bacterium]|nr:lipocalin-like domain-containing protein [Dehalococcoidia bacterium]